MSRNYMFYGYCLSSILEKSDISENFDIYDFGWMFSALLFSRMSQWFMEDEHKSFDSLLTNRDR